MSWQRVRLRSSVRSRLHVRVSPSRKGSLDSPLPRRGNAEGGRAMRTPASEEGPRVSAWTDLQWRELWGRLRSDPALGLSGRVRLPRLVWWGDLPPVLPPPRLSGGGAKDFPLQGNFGLCPPARAAVLATAL